MQAINDMVIRMRVEGESQAKASLNGVNSSVSKLSASVKNTLKGFVGLASASAAAYASFRFFSKSIEAFKEEENAINAMNAALINTAVFSEKLSNDLIKNASALQKMTIYGDEAIMAATARMQAVGNIAADQIMQAQKAAIGLAAAFGMDLETAFTLVGKAAAGSTAMLARYGIVLGDNLSQQEKFAKVLEIGASKFALAEAAAQTTSGRLAQMKNTISDLMETIGGALAPTIKQLAEMLSDFVRSIQPELAPILKILSDIAAKLLPAIMPLVNAFLTLVKQVVTAIAPVTDAITNLVTNVVVAALPIISKLTELINKSISVWSEFAARIFNALTPALTELLNASLPLVNAFVDLNIALMPIYTRILETATVLVEKLLPVITAVIAELGRILAPLAKFESLLAGNKEGVDDYSLALSNCSDAYRSIINANSNYTNSIQAVQNETNKQLQKYDELVLKLTNINKSTADAKTKHDQMKAAINELNNNYGAFIGKINLEKMAWDEVAKSLKNARDRLIEYNIYLIYQKQIDALIEKVASLTIAFDELDKKRKEALPDLERYNTPESQKYGQEYWGAMGGNPAWGAQLASKSPSSEWGRAKSALDTAKKQLDEAYKNAEAAKSKVQDIIEAIDKAQPVKTASEITAEQAAKAKQQLDNLLKTVDEFINISRQGIKTTAAEDFATYVKAYEDTIATIKDSLNVGIINQKKANDLMISMQQAFAAHYAQLVKDMNSDVVDLYIEGAKSEQEKIQENYDKQKAIIEAKISEIQAIIAQTSQAQISLGVKGLDKQISDLQEQIDLLNEALVNLGANMGREIEALAAKEAEAAAADVQKAQAQMHDFYQAQIDNIDALKLSQSDYLQYRTYLIDEEIAELQKLGFTEEELADIRSAKIRQAEDDYKQWSQSNIKAMAEMESRLKDIAEHIDDAILDDLANAFTDLLFSSKNFADSMKKMMHDMVTYMISEIMKLIVKMLMLKAVEASIGLFGTGGGGGGNVAPDLIGNIPIASYSGGARPAVASLGESSTVVKLLQKMSDIEQSIADNRPVVYTQLIEGVPLRNAVRKAEIQANIMGRR